METENKNIINKEIITGMFGAMIKNLKRAITVFFFLGLMVLNIATLTISSVHDFLYKGLSSIPILNMAELLANSPTERNKRTTSDLKKKNKAIKQKLKITSNSIRKRTIKTVEVNVGSMFTEALPYIGIATIIGAAVYEVAAACSNMKEMDELLQFVEGEADSSETNKICGQKLPGAEEINRSISDKLGGTIDEVRRKMETLKDPIGGTIDEMLH